MAWLGALLVACASAPLRPEAESLPALALERSDGKLSSFQAELGGAVAVVDLWATWCTACELQRPKLARLDAAYRARGLRVIGLDVGESQSVVRDYVSEHPLPYPTYLDPELHIADALGGARTLPLILVVDRGGHIVHRAAGLDAATLKQVKVLLAESQAP